MNNHSWFQLLRLELIALIANPVISLTMFGGVIFYSFLYPLPYSQEVVRQLPVSVVNLDNSNISYKLERMIDASPQLRVVKRSPSINQAEEDVLNQSIGGFIVIPENFYRDLLLGKSPAVSIAGDASYFLVYGAVVEGTAYAVGTLGAEVRITRLLSKSTPLPLAQEQYSSFKANMKPTFNPTMGYVNYVVPAVFVLILQQTLAMASGLITCTQKASSIKGYASGLNPLTLFSIRVSALLIIYFVLSMFYFGYSFTQHGIAQLGSINEIIAMLFPFLIASISIGICLGMWLPRRELVTVMVLVSSMPLIFTAGFIWPLEMVPQPMIDMAALAPSSAAIKSFLALNQMGASWNQVTSHFTHLWSLAIAWSLVALFTLFRFQSRNK